MKLSLAAGSVAVAGLLLFGLAGPMHWMGLPLERALTLVRWSAYVALLGAALSAGAGWWARRTGRRGPLAVSALAVLLGVLSSAVSYGWQRSAWNAPPVFDVSTDLENPPEFEALVERRQNSQLLSRTRAVDLLQRQHYPDLAPLVLSEPAPVIFERARLVADNLGWTIVASDPEAGRIEATETTRWFGFTDDIVVRVTPWGAGARVDVRSAARSGGRDAGTNARRVRRFLAALEER
jgi:uncharacterized protein (DUF1499 family)